MKTKKKTTLTRFEMMWYCMMRIKAAAMESDGMTPRNAAGARDSVSAGQKTVVQQLLSFPQPFTITRPKLYNPLPSKSPIWLGSSKTVLFSFDFPCPCVVGLTKCNRGMRHWYNGLLLVQSFCHPTSFNYSFSYNLQESDNSNFDSL